jgi:hypothetical protein
MNHNITDLGIPAESELRGIGIKPVFWVTKTGLVLSLAKIREMLSERVSQSLTIHVSTKPDFNLDNLSKLHHLKAYSGVKHVSRV